MKLIISTFQVVGGGKGIEKFKKTIIMMCKWWTRTSVEPCAYAMVQLKTITIKHFFKKRFKLYIVLAYTFFKSYISKICNSFLFRPFGFFT